MDDKCLNVSLSFSAIYIIKGTIWLIVSNIKLPLHFHIES
jgi:hypothetical protein